MAKQIAANVRRLRKARDWSQAELGEKVGLSRSGVGQIERGQVDPSYSTLQAIADVFGVAIGDITGAADDTPDLTLDDLQIARLYHDLDLDDKSFVRRLLRKLGGEPPSPR